jgi:hypothetical protein
MDHDDGKREWTAEIRADSRRQGGRFASKWLKEEKGGGAAQEGGGAAGPSQNPVNSPTSGPSTDADVSSGLETNNHNSPGNIHAAIISRQPQSLAINNNRTPQAFTLSQNIPIDQSNPLLTPTVTAFIPPASVYQNVTIPPLFPSDNQLNPTSNINSPMILTQPITENINSPSFTHQLLTFTSQAINSDPHAVNHKPTRHTRAIHKTATLNRPNLNLASDPTQNRTRPEKKPKPSIPKNPNQPQMATAAKPENMDELQSDKKRRREEDNSINNETSHDQVHFLTAGPGRPACRDQ